MKWPWKGWTSRDERSDQIVTHGELRLIVLYVVAQRPLTGLEIEWAIDRQLALAGLESASVAVVVEMLDQLDYVRMHTHGMTYSLTADGGALLERNARLVEMVLARIGLAIPPDLPLLQSLDELRGAIGQRLARGGLTDAQVQAVTRTINAVKVKLEHA